MNLKNETYIGVPPDQAKSIACGTGTDEELQQLAEQLRAKVRGKSGDVPDLARLLASDLKVLAQRPDDDGLRRLCIARIDALTISRHEHHPIEIITDVAPSSGARRHAAD